MASQLPEFRCSRDSVKMTKVAEGRICELEWLHVWTLQTKGVAASALITVKPSCKPGLDSLKGLASALTKIRATGGKSHTRR